MTNDALIHSIARMVTQKFNELTAAVNKRLDAVREDLLANSSKLAELEAKEVPQIDITAKDVEEKLEPLVLAIDDLKSAPAPATQAELTLLGDNLAECLTAHSLALKEAIERLKTADIAIEALNSRIISQDSELEALKSALSGAEGRFQADLAQMRAFTVSAQSEAPERWVAGIYRAGTKCAHNFGDEYIALRDTAEVPSPGATDWKQSRVGMRLRLDNTGEHLGDLFVKDYSTWIVGSEGPVLFAARGAKGIPGLSVKGEQGEAGDGIADIECSASGIVVSTITGKTYVLDLNPMADELVNRLLAEVMRE